MKRLAVLALLVVAGGMVHEARAHFLFMRICPPAEGGRVAEVYFSEYATAGDPRYIDKVATAEFSLQTTPGEFRPLAMRRLSDRLRAHVPASGTLMIAGQLDYGVLERPGNPPFLLRHYSKAVAGTPAEINALQAKGTPLELTAVFEADQVVLKPLLGGKPMPKVRLDTVDADLAGEELTTDENGLATFKPEQPGVYCVYVGHTLQTPGEHSGKRYQEVREFATLSFAWPLVRVGADDEAVAMFEEALASRAAWHDFPGFTAEIAGEVEGRALLGFGRGDRRRRRGTGHRRRRAGRRRERAARIDHDAPGGQPNAVGRSAQARRSTLPMSRRIIRSAGCWSSTAGILPRATG